MQLSRVRALEPPPPGRAQPVRLIWPQLKAHASCCSVQAEAWHACGRAALRVHCSDRWTSNVSLIEARPGCVQAQRMKAQSSHATVELQHAAEDLLSTTQLLSAAEVEVKALRTGSQEEHARHAAQVCHLVDQTAGLAAELAEAKARVADLEGEVTRSLAASDTIEKARTLVHVMLPVYGQLASHPVALLFLRWQHLSGNTRAQTQRGT